MVYTPLAFNCLYDCEYCYLQGLYPSANQVLFVNIDDYKNEIQERLKQDSLYICLSYDCDILAMEGVFGLAKEFIEFAKIKDNLMVEIRTKSANFNSLKNTQPNNQTILAWSLSPNSLIKKHELGTPNLTARLNAAQKAIDAGFKVRFALEPILAVPNWQDIYKNMIDEIFKSVDGTKLDSVNIDQFRMSKPILKRIQKMREDSYILHENLVEDNGLISYKEDTILEIKHSLKSYLSEHISQDKIFI